MANIARLDPFTDSFEDLFRRVLRPMRWEGEEQPLQIKVDVEEDDKSYKVKAEVPGVKKEDINVIWPGRRIEVRGTVMGLHGGYYGSPWASLPRDVRRESLGGRPWRSR
jgi:HSP20 family protein